jgi:hypothetical protein
MLNRRLKLGLRSSICALAWVKTIATPVEYGPFLAAKVSRCVGSP